MTPTVAIDCFHGALPWHEHVSVVVAVDVIRATTTAVTAASLGWRCFPVASLDAALGLAAVLDDPLLMGELGGHMPYGFDETNSPVAVSRRADTHRPIVLLSTSGTPLISAVPPYIPTYVACLRNVSAQARALAGRYQRIALVGAASRGEFREEDQICCAWIARELMQHGYVPENAETAATVDRWHDSPVTVVAQGKSADYLRRTGQMEDLEFVCSHVDDLNTVFAMRGQEVQQEPPPLG